MFEDFCCFDLYHSILSLNLSTTLRHSMPSGAGKQTKAQRKLNFDFVRVIIQNSREKERVRGRSCMYIFNCTVDS